MEREASTWGLESGDVHSPVAVGSPEGSLKGEGRTGPLRSVPENGCGLWEEDKEGQNLKHLEVGWRVET